MKKLFSLVGMLYAASSIAEAAPLGLRVGENFAKARVKLYADGWRADPGAHLSSGEYFGVDRLLIQSGYDEVDFCSMGKSFCTFQYLRNSNCLRLQTEGEQIHTMKIKRWSDQCRQQAADDNQHLPPADIRYLAQWHTDCKDFGQCEGFDNYLMMLKKKYARNSVLTNELGRYARTADSNH